MFMIVSLLVLGLHDGAGSGGGEAKRGEPRTPAKTGT